MSIHSFRDVVGYGVTACVTAYVDDYARDADPTPVIAEFLYDLCDALPAEVTFGDDEVFRSEGTIDLRAIRAAVHSVDLAYIVRLWDQFARAEASHVRRQQLALDAGGVR